MYRLSGSVSWVRATKAARLGSMGHTENLKNITCVLSSLVLGVNAWVQENSSRIVLPLTRHQCSIHCESSRVVHGASNRTTRETPDGETDTWDFTFRPA